MAELDPWDGSFRLWAGAPKSKYKAAIVASRADETSAAVKRMAEMVHAAASAGLATHGGGEHWGSTGISNIRVELRAGNFTDWHINLVADGENMDADQVRAALWVIENGRRSYKNKFGRRIPALQGQKILARAAGGFGG